MITSTCGYLLIRIKIDEVGTVEIELPHITK